MIIKLCNLHAHAFSYVMLPHPIKLNIMKECKHYLFYHSCRVEDVILNATEENEDKKFVPIAITSFKLQNLVLAQTGMLILSQAILVQNYLQLV